MKSREHEYEILRRMKPAGKLDVLRALIRQAYELKAAGIRLLQPDLTEEEVQAEARRLVAGD
ncbi:MAG TPA: hypothetical protein VMN60_06860 [Longimicrobiales bacterium]|nr:hypothetical protein [Longimicrobiales bacterium]